MAPVAAHFNPALQPGHFVVLSLNAIASCEWINTREATDAAAQITPGKYLAFVADKPNQYTNASYFYLVVRSLEGRRNTLIPIGENMTPTGHFTSLPPIPPLPWSTPCAIDVFHFHALTPHSVDASGPITALSPADLDLWRKYASEVRARARGREIEEMQDEMDKYRIPEGDRASWEESSTSSEPVTIAPKDARSDKTPLISVDVSVNLGVLDDVPDHRNFEQEMNQIHHIRRLYSRPEYYSTAAWVEHQADEVEYVRPVSTPK